MYFEIVGEISQIETIAQGPWRPETQDPAKTIWRQALAQEKRRRRHGSLDQVRLINGSIRWAEVHWYEAQGIGRKGWKIKRFLD